MLETDSTIEQCERVTEFQVAQFVSPLSYYTCHLILILGHVLQTEMTFSYCTADTAIS